MAGTSLQTRVDTVRDLLERSKSQIATALPAHVRADRFLRLAMTTLQKTPALLECDPRSLVAACMEAAQLGLEIDGALGHAYLVPYKLKSGRTVAQFIPGYRGLIDLCRRSGNVSTIGASCVYANEKFKVTGGDEIRIHHEIKLSGRGKLVAVYAVCKLRDGGKEIEVMSVDQVEDVRARSKAAHKGPWVTDYEEMAKKTVLRRLCKRLPVSVETQKALAIDDEPDYDAPSMDLGGEIVDADFTVGPGDDVDQGEAPEHVDQRPEAERHEQRNSTAPRAHDAQPVVGNPAEVLAEAQQQIAAAGDNLAELKKIDDFFQRDDVSQLCRERADQVRAGRPPRGERSNAPR